MTIENLSHAQYIALAYVSAALVLLAVLVQSVFAYAAARRAARKMGIDIRRGDDAVS